MARRRQFSAKYKLDILKRVSACVAHGQLGELLRSEGLYSSHLVTWRRQRDAGELAGLTPKKRGRKKAEVDVRDRKIVELQRENTRLMARAERAEALVDLQKKVAACWGRRWKATSRDGSVDGDRQQDRRCAGLPRAGVARRHVLPAAFAPNPWTPTEICPAATARALPPEERQQVLAVLNEPRFMDLRHPECTPRFSTRAAGSARCAPCTASSTRTAKSANGADQLRHPEVQETRAAGDQANQVWTWDITKLLGRPSGPTSICT